jgi:hypothetical protein
VGKVELLSDIRIQMHRVAKLLCMHENQIREKFVILQVLYFVQYSYKMVCFKVCVGLVGREIIILKSLLSSHKSLEFIPRKVCWNVVKSHIIYHRHVSVKWRVEDGAIRCHVHSRFATERAKVSVRGSAASSWRIMFY